MKVEFIVKYGKNVIDIPITEKTVPAFDSNRKTDFFAKKVTIFNDIPKDGVTPRHFDRNVIEKCNIQGGVIEKADGTISNISNAKTVTTKDVSRFLPLSEYVKKPEDERAAFFTASPDDFVVFDEVSDVVTTIAEFAELRKKYKNNGISVTAVNDYIYGTALDNVQIIGA